MSRLVIFLWGTLLFPVRLAGRLLGHLLSTILTPVSQHFDSSPGLSNMINSLSSAMASRRGLPLLVGTGLVGLSLLAHLVVLVMLASTDDYDNKLYWLCIPFALLHIGVLVGFTGAMFAVPMGQSYKDQ